LEEEHKLKKHHIEKNNNNLIPLKRGRWGVPQMKEMAETALESAMLLL